MPQHLEYHIQKEKGDGFIIIDKRLFKEKFFKVRIDSKLSYFYGDDSFDISLINILKNYLVSNYSFKDSSIEITINRIILAASINEVRIDKQAYSVSEQFIINSDGGSTGVVGVILAEPIIGAIEQARSRRSIWCHIDYEINGKEFSVKEVSSAKSGQLAEEIVRLYMEAIDEIATGLSTE